MFEYLQGAEKNRTGYFRSKGQRCFPGERDAGWQKGGEAFEEHSNPAHTKVLDP